MWQNKLLQRLLYYNIVEITMIVLSFLNILVVMCYNFIFLLDAYGFGYDVGPSGQFHHENRGPDGVTYGCYGYVDTENYLRATHYVADSHGYRVVEPEKPVEVFPDDKYEYDEM